MAKQKESILKSFDYGVGYGQTKEARKPSILEKIIEQLVTNSEEDYKVKTMEYKDEACYESSLALFQKELQQRKNYWIKKNQELAADNIKTQVKRYANRFAERIGNKAIPLPMDETNLNSRLTNAGSELVTEFETMFSDFRHCCNYESQLNELQETVLKIGRDKQQENIKAYRNIVNDVFKKAKDVIKVAEEKYGTQYSFRKFVEEIASKLLAEGKAANWDAKLKTKVIDDFIKEDPEISAMMEAKKGLLATIIGFLEYLLSFIGF